MISKDVYTVHWSEAESAKLAELWALGKTASEIARQLHEEFKSERTRNSVVSKVHRSNLPGRKSPIIRKEKTPEQIKQAEIDWRNSELLLLPKDRTICHHPECHAVKARGNYCEAHASVYYEDRAKPRATGAKRGPKPKADSWNFMD